jgi:hypothetical protein
VHSWKAVSWKEPPSLSIDLTAAIEIYPDLCYATLVFLLPYHSLRSMLCG